MVLDHISRSRQEAFAVAMSEINLKVHDCVVLRARGQASIQDAVEVLSALPAGIGLTCVSGQVGMAENAARTQPGRTRYVAFPADVVSDYPVTFPSGASCTLLLFDWPGAAQLAYKTSVNISLGKIKLRVRRRFPMKIVPGDTLYREVGPRWA